MRCTEKYPHPLQISLIFVWSESLLPCPHLQFKSNPTLLMPQMEGHWKMKVTIYFVKSDDHYPSVPKDFYHRPCEDVVQTPWSPRSNDIIVSLFVNLVPTISHTWTYGKMCWNFQNPVQISAHAKDRWARVLPFEVVRVLVKTQC